MLERRHLEHFFQYLWAMAGPLKHRGARENFPPFFPPLSTGLLSSPRVFAIWYCLKLGSKNLGCTRFRLPLRQIQNPAIGNPAKSSYGKISSWVCRMLLQHQYIQLITDKMNAADLSSSVFAILISVTWMIIIQNSFPLHKFVKTGKQWRNKGSTELYCLSIAADSIADAISFIRCIVLWSQNKFSPNPDLVRFVIVKPQP